MLRRILRSKKGSTLVLVLVTLTILSILGTAIISLSVINFRMKIADKNAKTSFYLAEAGLAEAHALIGKEVEGAIKAGNEKVKDNLDKFIEKERKKERFNPESDDSVFIKESNGYGEVVEEKMIPVIEEWFKLGFATYINDNLEDDLGIHGYGIVDEAIVNGDDKKKASVTVEGEPKLYQIHVPIRIASNGKPSNAVDMKKGGPVPYGITLLSSFEHNSIKKQVRGRFTIKIPPYRAPYYVKNIKAEIDENILWKKAITTQNNLYVTGKDVTINGDVYAYGTKPSNLKECRKFGGIVVGSGKAGSVIINGNAVANSYIHTNYDNSSIIIKGNAYCNSLVVQEGTSGSSIVVQNSAYTEDDIELNGNKAKIDIHGDYYGFSDGSNKKEKATHDESSSIVINSQDIGQSNGSSLKIKGDTYIGGTVYIDLADKNYQTGESVSIKGNYRAYTESLRGIADNPDTIEEDESRYNNVQLGTYSPLVLADKFRDDKEMTAINKSKYFSYSSNAKPENLNLGTSSSIDINNIKFSTGAYISKGKVSPSVISNIGEMLHILKEKHEEYNKHVNNMSDERESDSHKRIYIHDKVKNPGRFSFAKDIDYVEDIKIDVGGREKIIKKMVYVNRGSKDLYIIGKNGSHSGMKSNDKAINAFGAEGIDGVVITEGNVYLRGELNYRGTIAAKGNIYIEDEEPKVITNDLNYIRNITYKDKIEEDKDKKLGLWDQFVNNGGTVTFLYQSQAGADDVGSYLKYEDIVDILWERVK